MILNPCGPKNGFFYSHRWRKKWYCTFVGVQLVFFSNRWKTKWVAHLWARKWFYLFTQEKKKNDIAHLKAHKWFFDSHTKRKKMILHTLIEIHQNVTSICDYMRLLVICNYLWTFLQFFFMLVCNYITTNLQLFWFSSFYVNNI